MTRIEAADYLLNPDTNCRTSEQLQEATRTCAHAARRLADLEEGGLKKRRIMAALDDEQFTLKGGPL